MLIYHIINRSEELAATTNPRTAKAQAKELNAYAVVAVDTCYTQDGMQSKLICAYVRARNIGIYITYSSEDLRRMADRNCHLLPPRFLDSFNVNLEQDV